jgi:type IV secretory pathway protease TraF
MIEHVVGLQPHVACEFKRAGFLEGKAIGISLPIDAHGGELQLGR